MHIASLAAHTTLNTYKPTEISIEINTDARTRDRTRNVLITRIPLKFMKIIYSI